MTLIQNSNNNTRPYPRYTTPLLMWAIAVFYMLFKLFLQFSSGVMLEQLMRDFKTTAFGAGLLSGAYYLIYVSLQIPTGVLFDRFGTRRLLTMGASACALGCYLFSRSDSILTAGLSRLLIGFGCAFSYVACLYIVTQWFPRKRFALLIGTGEAVGMTGSILANISLAHIMERVSWRDCLLSAAMIAAVTALCIWIFIRDKKEQNKVPKNRLWQDTLTVIKNPTYWYCGLFIGMNFSVFSVFTGLWGIPYLELAEHYNKTMATLIGSLPMIGLALGCPAMGWLYNHIHNKNRFLMSNAFCGAVILSLIVYAPPSNIWLLVSLMLALGIACSAYVICFSIVTHVAPPAQSGTALGLTNMLCVITAPILQPLIGWLLDVSHGDRGISIYATYTVSNYHHALFVLPLGLLAACVFAYRLKLTP